MWAPVQLLTAGGYKSSTIGYFIYSQAKAGNYKYPSAIGLLVSVIVVPVVLRVKGDFFKILRGGYLLMQNANVLKQKRSNKIKRGKGESVFMWIMFALFLFYALSVILPFFWTIMNSLKSNGEFFENWNSFPSRLKFENYADAFEKINYNDTNLIGMFFNSLILTVENTLAAVIFPLMTAYVIAKYPYKFCKFLYGLALVVQVLPTIGSLPVEYKLVYDLGINDNFFLIWILSAGSFSFNFLILYAGFRSVSWTYAESAMIDGAGHYTVFFKIMLPQAKPFITAIAITTFISQWNNYNTPFLYLDRYPTMALGLYDFQQKQLYGTQMSPLFAGIILSVLPVAVLFTAMQKTIMENTVAGGIKG